MCTFQHAAVPEDPIGTFCMRLHAFHEFLSAQTDRVCAILLCSQGMQLTLPFTIAVYMVRNWEGHISEERVSRLTGLLAAVYSSSSFLTALGWGYLSDHIGRKPVVVFGNVVGHPTSTSSLLRADACMTGRKAEDKLCPCRCAPWQLWDLALHPATARQCSCGACRAC